MRGRGPRVVENRLAISGCSQFLSPFLFLASHSSSFDLPRGTDSITWRLEADTIYKALRLGPISTSNIS